MCTEDAAAIVEFLNTDGYLTLGDLIRHPSDRNRHLKCIPLAIHRDTGSSMLPANDEPLHVNDTVLFCATEHSELLLSASLNNPYTLHYLATGMELPRGLIFRWLARLRDKEEVSCDAR